MMRKAWSNTELVPYPFSRSSVNYSNFKVTWDKKLPISTRIECFQLEFTDGNQMMQQTWYGINEVPYCFSRLSIKFQDHMGWKIDNMNPIWVMLLGQSQLSNPSDLSCYIFCCQPSAALVEELLSSPASVHLSVCSHHPCLHDNSISLCSKSTKLAGWHENDIILDGIAYGSYWPISSCSLGT